MSYLSENREFYTQLKKLVVPIMIQAFMLSLVSATDAIMLGFVDQTSLAAVSLAGQVQFVLNMFVLGIAAGAAILLAQYWGKQDLPVIERIVPVALRVSIAGGILFTAGALFTPEAIMRILTNDGPLIESGTAYLRAVSLSYLLCSVSQVYLALLKNTGRARISSVISSSAVVVNIVCNTLLIFGFLGFPKLGIVGAAYATVISRGLELVWCIFETERHGHTRVRWRRMFCREPEITKDFVQYTTPVLMASLVWGIAYTLYTVIMGHMGGDAVAANSVTAIAKAMISCVIRGLGGGAGVLVGNVLGSGDLEKAKDYGGKLSRLSIAAGVVSGLALMAVSPVIVHYSPLTETARSYLQGMLLFCGVNLMFQSVNHVVLDGVFTAGGDAKFDMVTNIKTMWIHTVPLGFLAAFVFKWPVLAVYCIVNMDEIVKIPAVYRHYRKYVWLRNLTRDI